MSSAERKGTLRARPRERGSKRDVAPRGSELDLCVELNAPALEPAPLPTRLEGSRSERSVDRMLMRGGDVSNSGQ